MEEIIIDKKKFSFDILYIYDIIDCVHYILGGFYG